MATVTVQQAYATDTESDTYLALKEDWLDADPEIKDDALLWGRYYIDENFDCVIDADDIPDEVKFANSLLGYDYFLQGDLFFDNQRSVLIKKVKAAPVETEVEYGSRKREKPNSLSKVVSILSGLCNNTHNSLIRV